MHHTAHQDHEMKSQSLQKWIDDAQRLPLLSVFLGAEGLRNALDFINDVKSMKELTNRSVRGSRISTIYGKFLRPTSAKSIVSMISGEKITAFGDVDKAEERADGRCYDDIRSIVYDRMNEAFLTKFVSTETFTKWYAERALPESLRCEVEKQRLEFVSKKDEVQPPTPMTPAVADSKDATEHDDDDVELDEDD